MSNQSNQSTSLIPPTRWASGDFLLSAGCCMIQPSTGKVVVIQDTATKEWLLPRGRKDIGETMEAAAFREAYEESGFRPEPLPLIFPHRQPESPEQKIARGANPYSVSNSLTTTEPVYITTMPVPSGSSFVPPGTRSGDYEYVVFWYAAGVPADATWQKGTGVEFEENYVGQLVSIEKALEVLPEPESFVMKFTYNAWLKTREALDSERTEA